MDFFLVNFQRYNEYLFFKDHGKYLSEYVIFSTNPIARSLMHVINAFLPK